MSPYPPRLAWLAVGFISAAVLGYEVVLLRWASVTTVSQCASILMSGSLVGFTASGAALSVLRVSGQSAYTAASTVNAGLFALSSVACIAAAQVVTLDAYDAPLSIAAWFRPLAVTVLLAIPPFFAGNCIALALQRYSEAVGRVFGIALIGAGLGAVATIAALFKLSPGQALCGVAGLGVIAGLFGFLATPGRPRWAATSFATALATLFAVVGGVDLEPSPHSYKPLPRLLSVLGAREIAQRSGPLGGLRVVHSPLVPLRHAPGMALNSQAVVPDQLAVFRDGGRPSFIHRYDGTSASTAHLDEVPAALPYHLLGPRPSVLILGSGGGGGVLQALAHQASRVDAVEVNPQLTALVRGRFSEFAGRIYSDPRVLLHVADLRSFVRASDDRWGLIQLSLLDQSTPEERRDAAFGDGSTYTVEGLIDCLRRLEPGGMLVISDWTHLPPVDGIRLFATAIASLEHLGVKDAGRRLVWIRGWQVSSLVIKNGDFSADEFDRIRRFVQRRGFDEAYLFDQKAQPGGLRYPSTGPHFTAPARWLLAQGRDKVLRTNPYATLPATDDRPHRFGPARELVPAWSWSETAPLGPCWARPGYPLVVAATLQALLIGMIFIAAPVRSLLRQRPSDAASGRTARTVAYFSATGLASVLALLMSMQRFTAYLMHPLFAVPVVLAAFLVFGGVGSGLSSRIPRRSARGRVILAVIGLAALWVSYWYGSPSLLDTTLAWPFALKLTLVLAMIAPLALCMGVLFPLGSLRLTYEGAVLLPWALGIHAGAAALASPAAMLLTIHLGQSALLPLSMALCAIAALSIP